MTYTEFRETHFAGNDDRAIAHLAHESYYAEYTLTGSREELQIILDTMTRPEAKLYMAEFKKAVKANREPARKKYAPLLDTVSGRDSSWKYDEEFLRKDNPFGKEIKKYGLISLAGIAVIAVLLLAFPDYGKILGGYFAVFAVWAGSGLIGSVGNYFTFKKAAEKLAEKGK